jgi:hypothetical protein
MVIDVSKSGIIQKGGLGLILVTEVEFSVIDVICIGACPMFFILIVAMFVFVDASTLSIKRELPGVLVAEQTWIDCCSDEIVAKLLWVMVGVMYVVFVSWVLSGKVAITVIG